MELLYAFTPNGIVFYTGISLNDRFKQYQTFNPPPFQQELPRFFNREVPPRPTTESARFSWNSFEKAPIVWDSTFHGQSSFWTCFRETNRDTSEGCEPIIYSPPATDKKKRRRNRKRKRSRKTRRNLTKEELDDELDGYMIKCF